MIEVSPGTVGCVDSIADVGTRVVFVVEVRDVATGGFSVVVVLCLDVVLTEGFSGL